MTTNHTPNKETTMTLTIPTPVRPTVTKLHNQIGANVTEEGFFIFTVNGTEVGTYLLGSWGHLEAVHADLGLMECKRWDYHSGSVAFTLDWPETEFGHHPFTTTWGRADSLEEAYKDAILFLAGYYAGKSE